MDIIGKISEAIYGLEILNCKRQDIIIAFSPLIEKFIIEEIHENKMAFVAFNSLEKIQGIKTYNLHPYNEIVIYDSNNASYYPELIKKIEFSMKSTHQIEVKL